MGDRYSGVSARGTKKEGYGQKLNIRYTFIVPEV